MPEKNDVVVIHGVYFGEGYCFFRHSVRIHPDSNLKSLKTCKPLVLPEELMVTLERKHKSWKLEMIEFTYGFDPQNGYATLAIVSPKDIFKRKIGYSIVMGRLRKAVKVIEDEEWSKNKNQRQIIKLEVT